MIFSSLFRPKHQDPNPQIRINAIAKLSAKDPEQKSLLHELAFNDPDANVSIAALSKLDSFVLWYKMAQTAKNERVAKKSQQVIEQILLSEQSDKINQQEKRAFIEESTDNKILEKLVLQPWLQEEIDLAVLVLDKLGKPQLSKQILFSTKNVDLQLKLLKAVDDENGLNKVLKKVTTSEVKQAAQQQLDDMLASKQLPIAVDKDTRLILARLLALKDSGDLPYIEEQRSNLLESYHRLAAQFSCLPISSKQSFEDKFSEISQKLAILVAALKPIWQRKQAAVELQKSVQLIVEQSNKLLSNISTQLDESIADITPEQQSELAQQVDSNLNQVQQLIHQLANDAEQPRRHLEKLNNQLLSCKNTLHSLPEFQLAIEQANILIEQFSGLTLPDDISQLDAAQQHLRDMQNRWKELTTPFSENWPHKVKQQWIEQNKKWQQAVKGLKDSLQNDVDRCRNKMRALDSMVDQGKFKLAMGLYKKVLPWYQTLPEKQQDQLERQFSKVKEQIENLRDWQDYIAAPRKPVLLAEAEALAEKPLEIDQQAKKIKELRQQWNSLGKLESESDQALNKAFEETIERAFSPCRDFYNQQNLQRDANLSAKQQVISTLAELPGLEITALELAKKIRILQQQWQSIGEVDFKQREEINIQFRTHLAPLKERVNQFYQDNAELKHNLLAKAQKLLTLESVSDAIEQAKKLQANWKTIEHAGRKAENELWAAFREVNDQVFARLKAEQQQERQIVDEQIEQAKAMLNALKEKIEQADDKASLIAAIESQQEVTDALKELPEKVKAKFEHTLSSSMKVHQEKLTELELNQHKQQYKDLFTALQQWSDETLPELLTSLPNAWQQCFKEATNTDARRSLTITMEIVANQDSPKKDNNERKAIQLQLMADKLQQGEQPELLHLLKLWIRQGPLTAKDMELLKRVEQLF